jgi:HlyD family secretion protein
MRPWIRRAALLLALLALAGGIGWGFAPQPPLVDVAPVDRGPLRMTIEEEGRTRVRDRYVVSSPVPGFQHRLELEVGDVVSAGQALARIEPLRATGLDPRSRAEAQARVAANEALVQQTEQQRRVAANEAALAETLRERAARLLADGTATRDDLDQLEARARSAAASLRSADFAVQAARYHLEAARTALLYTSREVPEEDERLEVLSPVAGRVLRILRESEGVVAAGQPILELGDPAALEVEVEVLSADAVRLGTGTRVLLERWGGDAPLEGRVRRVEPVGFTKVSALGVEEQRVLVIVDLASPPEAWQRLGDGYRVEAVFVLWAGQDVLRVPQSALFRDPQGSGWCAFVLSGGRAARRAVEVGERNGLTAQVLGGLSAGETVIVHPPDEVRDGGRVRPR